MSAEKTVKILNDEGMHARPAGIFAKKASEFKSTVEIKFNGVSKNAKSIMSLMSMGLTKDAEVVIVATGPDEVTAAETLAYLVNNRFQA